MFSQLKKHGHLTNYTLQLVETEFEIMSSEANKKFTFTEMTPPSNTPSLGSTSPKSQEQKWVIE